MSYQLMPKVVTDLEPRNGRYIALFQRIWFLLGANYVNVVEVRPIKYARM